MNANELMLGDIVYYEYDGEIFPAKVLEIYRDAVLVEEIHGQYEPIEIELKNIYPILLTAEILEKNGWKHEFDKTDYMVKYDLAVEGKNCWMMWAVKEHNLDIQRQDEKLDMYNLKVQRVCIPCDYVHELQRALRLCNIDKEIVL